MSEAVKKLKQQSNQESAHVLFQHWRTREMAAINLSAPDEEIPAREINARWKPLVDAAIASGFDPEDVVFGCIYRYLAAPEHEKRPPGWPEKLFLSRQIWWPLMEEAIAMEKDLAALTPEERAALKSAAEATIAGRK